ncbi:MAG TPA: hypothetical protein V6C72_12730 [Chroococcales cyanobacterium]
MPDQLFLLSVLSVAVACQLARFLLLSQMKRVQLSKSTALIARADLEARAIADEELRPCEIAYLHGNGDLSKALIVLAADLVQRALKQATSSQPLPPTAHYEEKMWSLTRTSVTGYLKDKAKEYVPSSLDDLAANPVLYAQRFSRVYRFFASTVRNFIVKVVNDPRHIRKYFSLPGLARLVGDFASAGYQNTLETELKEDLVNRGLLIPEQRRHLFSLFMWIVSAASIVAVLWLVISSTATTSIAATVFGLALFAALLLRGIFLLLNAVPLYTELAALAGHVDRKSFRLTLVKTISRSILAILYGVALFAFALVTGVAFLIFQFALHAPAAALVVQYICTAAALLSCIELLKTGFDVRFDQYPTQLAEAALKDSRKRLARTSPLGSFKEVLASPDYEATFSEILALYGIELLLLLA